ncbi:MAG: lipopolysaccharide heptosyltransferase II [Acidobacteria bacterium]|nr:lipopolysaccharide heptosyltransferase II [Acidobacteriota bacterium]
MNSFLIRATNWIGDCVMSLPAVKELRRLHPDARLSILARPWVADIYRVANVIDEVILFDREARPGIRGLLGWARDLRVCAFDCALLLQNAFEAAVITRLAGIPERIGYATQGRGFLLTRPIPLRQEISSLHQSYYYLNLLTESRLSPLRYTEDRSYQPDACLRLSSVQRLPAAKIFESLALSADKPLVGISPGASYGPAKRWLPDRYAAVADHVMHRWDAQVLLFGSADEAPIAREIQSNMRHQPILLTGRTTLLELLGLIERCDLFITNDSGPMHLAGALQRPLIALFGSTDENATGPMNARSHVIHKQVECTPCFLRTCPIDLRCFKQITVEEVCKFADQILKG